MSTMTMAADGFVLTLSPVPRQQRGDVTYFEGAVTLLSTVAGVTCAFQNFAEFPLTDLLRLCRWIDDHIADLVRNPPEIPGPLREGPVWVPEDLALEVRCDVGEVEREGDVLGGGFSILVMLNLVPDRRNEPGAYGGFRGHIGVDEVLAFCQAVRDYVARELGQR